MRTRRSRYEGDPGLPSHASILSTLRIPSRNPFKFLLRRKLTPDRIEIPHPCS